MIPAEFLIFAATLLGIAIFHRHTLGIALAGLIAVIAYKVLFADFSGMPGPVGLLWHLQAEWVLLTNLLALLVGFALLSRHFQQSHLPRLLPKILPDDWKGGFVLLAMVFVLSAFLDNIAAAMIGATVAGAVFRGRVHIGYLAAIVAASNAGGSGSVVGDTTTTMMWLDGVSPLQVLHAYVAAAVAFLVFAIPAARQQHRHSPIQHDPEPGLVADKSRLIVVALVLAGAVFANVYANNLPEPQSGAFPYIGATVIGILLLLTATSAAVVRYFWNSPGRESPWRELVAPAAATMLLAVMAWLVIDHFDVLLGVTPGSLPTKVLPALFGMAAVIGAGWALVLKRRRPETYAAIGLGSAAMAHSIATAAPETTASVRTAGSAR